MRPILLKYYYFTGIANTQKVLKGVPLHFTIHFVALFNLLLSHSVIPFCRIFFLKFINIKNVLFCLGLLPHRWRRSQSTVPPYQEYWPPTSRPGINNIKLKTPKFQTMELGLLTTELPDLNPARSNWVIA